MIPQEESPSYDNGHNPTLADQFASAQPVQLKLGELLVQEGLLTPEQVARVLAIQKVRKSLPLGELLVHSGLITEAQLEIALVEQRQTHEKLGVILLQKGWVSETILVSALYLQSQLTDTWVDSFLPHTADKYAALVVTRRLSQQALEEAIGRAQESRRSVETVLIHDYKISKQDIGHALSVAYKCPFLSDPQQLPIDPDLVRRINPTYLRANTWLPIRLTEESVEVLIDNPHAVDKLQDIKHLFPGKEIRCSVGLPEDIHSCIAALTGPGSRKTYTQPIETLLKTAVLEQPVEPEEPEELAVSENDSLIVQLVHTIMSKAYTEGASDIHIEPAAGKQDVRVRFRIDGACSEALRIPAHYRRALVARVKIMARLDIAEQRRPQDGKIKFRLSDRELEMRVATIPTVGTYNEGVVLRLLNSHVRPALSELAMTKGNLQAFHQLLAKPHGLLLCVGPTGAGKTTTLHASLAYLNTPNRKIWTVEDPVEMTQDGLQQVQVNPKIGFDFATALRALLRADPDIIMVGEMRDRETAEIGIQAALTGHLVLSTLHTNSAVETVGRLLDMGLDPFSFADSLLGVLAQRLTWTLCAQCKEWYHATKEEYERLAYGYGEAAFAKLNIPYTADFMLCRSRGCPACQQRGYKGRVGLHELLVVTQEISQLIQRRKRMADLLQTAVSQGMTTLMQDGILKVLQGWTDYKQVCAVALR